jgi:hypothetical protein
MKWGFYAFINRWLEKADGYDDNELAQLFDKFFTLYVVFNALYDEAFHQMAGEGQVTSQDRPEKERAVTQVARFLGHDELASQLRPFTKEISQVENIIRERRFYFNVTGSRRESDWNADQALASGLKSLDSRECCESILTLIYRTRCNMFHGQKEYDADQESVLRPMNIFLRRVIDILMEKLRIRGSS